MTITVALVGPATPRPLALGVALSATTPGAHRWHVTTAAHPLPHAVEIALCDSVTAVRAATARWPRATVVALARHGGSAVEQLDAGAHGCVENDNLELVAAYLVAAARRRGLLDAAHGWAVAS